MKKRIALVFTGGTISMVHDSSAGGAVPALSGSEIASSVPELAAVADFEIRDFGRYPGPHVTPTLMMALSRYVSELVADPSIQGVVITHGTDTLEETAYLLELTTHTAKPIVFTGAMRNSSESGWDGPSNLLAAARVAGSDLARNLGVLVVMNETILSAAEVSKIHTEAFDAFQSPDFGPLGFVDKGAVITNRGPAGRLHLDTARFIEPVWLLKMTSGSDSALIDASLDNGVKGLVIEALGRGNVPPLCLDGIRRAIRQSVPVVITSRCMKGRALDTYGYEGGGRQLRDAGALLAGYLTGQKARIKLGLALGITGDLERVRAWFEGSSYHARV